MSSMNGVLSPPPISDPGTSISLSSKRKREENVLDLESASLPELSPAESQALITDLIDVLKAEDTTPSILTRTITDVHLSDGPHSKRQKPGENVESGKSILGQLSSNVYKSVDEVLEDIDAAVCDMIDKLELSNGAAKNQFATLSRPLSELSLKFMAFNKRAHDLVKREKAFRKRQHNFNNNGASHSYFSNSGPDFFSQDSSFSPGNKLVLTLLGNAPAPKQLFSSLQLSTKINGDKTEVVIPIREAGLPNGITTSRIIPTHPPALLDNKKATQTLGEVFPTHSGVAPLIPPTPSKISTTKSLTVGWYHPESSESIPKTSSYFNQGISSGLWVQYNNAPCSNKDNLLKHKDRTVSFKSDVLSSSGVSTMAESTEPKTSELETYSRSAYSSFAPTRDDAAAIVPTGTLNRMWWQERGKNWFNRSMEEEEKINGTTTLVVPSKNEAEKEDDMEMKIFEQGLKELENNSIYPSLVFLESESEKPIKEKEVEEVLEGISELLETLASYQRIRHLSLNTPSLSSGLLSPPENSHLGNIVKPSESEQSTYEILKAQLTLIISTLPPYAVAKLNPERLADLSISTKIEVHVNEYKGVMEEEESATRAKMAASLGSSTSTSRATSQPIHRSSSGSSTPNSQYGNQFTISQPRGTMAQFYNPSQPPVRSLSTSIQRPPSASPIPYQAQRTSSSVPYRPNSYGASSYTHQSARPVQQQYVQANQPVQYPQSPSVQAYLRAPSQSYHQHPTQPVLQAAANSKFSNQLSSYSPQPLVQSSQNGMEYSQHNSLQIPRQVSQKPGYSPQPIAAQPQPNNTSSSPAISQRSQIYGVNTVGQPNVINGSTVKPSHSQYSQQSTALGAAQPYSTFMTHEQQQTMIQRQQAALANQHQGGQEHVRSVAQVALVSPSKSQSNGTSAVSAGL